MIYMNQGERFQSYRKKKNLSQKEAAELLGIKPYQLANYETNRSEPSIRVLKDMSRLYKVSIDRLVNNSSLQMTSEQQKLFEEEKAQYMNELEEIIDRLKNLDNKDQ